MHQYTRRVLQCALILTSVSAVACSNIATTTQPTATPTITTINTSSTYKPDLSDYGTINDSYDHIIGLKPEGLASLLQAKDTTGVFMIGYPGCSHCRHAMPALIEASNTLKNDVYYTNCMSSDYPFEGDTVITVFDELNDWLDVDPATGEKAIFTPFVFAIIDGEVIDAEVGVGDMNEQQLVERYSQMIAEVFSDERSA